MKRILIVYYSRTGNTKRVAQAIAAATGAEIEEIVDVQKREGGIAYLWSALQALMKMTAQIQPPELNPVDFELVVLGTPVWAGSVTPAMRSYIQQHSGNISTVAFFCSEGGNGHERVFKQMADACGVQPQATLIVTESEIKSGDYQVGIKSFATDINPAAKKSVTAKLHAVT